MADDLQTGGLPEWKLERYVLEELPDEEMQRIRRAAERDELFRKRIDALKASTRSLLELHAPEAMAGRIEKSLKRDARGTSHGRGSLSLGRLGWTLLPAAAIVALAVYPTLEPEKDQLNPVALQNTRVKTGSPSLQIFRKTVDGSEELKNGDLVRPGDVIQMKYRAGSHRRGAILSVDGRGAATVHLPESGNEAADLTPGRADTLGFAYELDDAPRWERFYLVTSDAPFSLGPLIRAAHRQPPEAGSGPLAISQKLKQNVIELRKVVPNDE